MTIIETTLADPRLLALLEESNAYAVDHSPPGKDYAVRPDDAEAADLRYWLAMNGEAALGCIGLKRLADDHGEIKSLHVCAPHRGGGIASALVRQVVGAATAAGLSRLSLETGQSEGYAASRAFYRRMGFRPCAPFGPYLNDGVSYCMTRRL